MAEIFGHRWTSNYGLTDKNDTWLKKLKGLSPEQIARGLVRCETEAIARYRSGDEIWPPNLLEFRALCLPAKRLAHFHGETKLLPKSKITAQQLRERRRELLIAAGLDPARADQCADWAKQ